MWPSLIWIDAFLILWTALSSALRAFRHRLLWSFRSLCFRLVFQPLTFQQAALCRDIAQYGEGFLD